MNIFTRELKKVFVRSSIADGLTYADKVCRGSLGADNGFQAELASGKRYGDYDGIQVSIVNKEGETLDSEIFKFEDILGMKEIVHPELKEISPHLWTYQNYTEWYLYKPTGKDYTIIADTIDQYLNIQQEHLHSPNRSDMNQTTMNL